ncbi:MAG TPA: hypothetical protein VMF52_18400 [Steroidobacteraceae bacterium]|nr:hypothetical protein [Steroidobacteraceae bacterium]
MTIKESRQLVLPLQTVLDAVVTFDRKSNGSLSRGDVVQAEFVPGTTLEAGLDVAVLAADEQVIEWRHFSIVDLAAAIISFCRSKRIPLPYAGTKSLSITEQGAAFQIETTVNVASPSKLDADLSGRPLRYAKGYEPYALRPVSQTESCV